MSDDSMFSKHLRLIETDESKWTPEDRKEFEQIQNLDLPPLTLPPLMAQSERDRSILADFRNMSAKLGKVIGGVLPAKPLSPGFAGAFAAACIVVLASITLLREDADVSDRLTPKGALQISVFWERAGKVSPMSPEANLVDGDKVGATVLSAEDGVAYWAITDRDFKILSDQADVEASQISLQAGVRKSFTSSFELVAPNQGENLVIVVCPKSSTGSQKNDSALLFDQAFIAKLTSDSRIRSSECVFVGSRLRRMP
jgi:hypothetical protein